MRSYRIPFTKPYLSGNEFAYMAEAVAFGHLSGDGFFTQKCHALLEKELHVPKALLTTSCTHALEMAALLLDIQAGDEIIVPSFTFVSTVNAFVLRGGRPVFADIRLDTLNLDEKKLESLITPRTKAVVVVHYAGVGCEMDCIFEIAKKYGIPVVEDNAHGLFGKYKTQYLGTLGNLATHSFDDQKNFTCGAGGALFINDPRYIERAEIIREKGTNRSRFFRGEVDKYSWVDLGSNYLPTELLAAFLYAQLECREEIQAKRRRIWRYYFENIRDWAINHDVRLPTVPDNCEQNYHMFYMLMPSSEQRRALIEHLKSRGILAIFHYLPLHLSEMGSRFSGKRGDCPISESVSDRLIRLPFYTGLTELDQSQVVSAICEFDGK